MRRGRNAVPGARTGRQPARRYWRRGSAGQAGLECGGYGHGVTLRALFFSGGRSFVGGRSHGCVRSIVAAQRGAVALALTDSMWFAEPVPIGPQNLVPLNHLSGRVSHILHAALRPLFDSWTTNMTPRSTLDIYFQTGTADCVGAYCTAYARMGTSYLPYGGGTGCVASRYGLPRSYVCS